MLAIAPDMLFVTFSEAVPQLSSTKPFPSLSMPSLHTSFEPINGLISGDGSLARDILIKGNNNDVTRSTRITIVMNAAILLLRCTLNSFIFGELSIITILWIMQVNALCYIE